MSKNRRKVRTPNIFGCLEIRRYVSNLSKFRYEAISLTVAKLATLFINECLKLSFFYFERLFSGSTLLQVWSDYLLILEISMNELLLMSTFLTC